ncbi:MAG: hypothetical protein DRN25_02695 [Thermoplasmata archaeon]|nr:MAG: hypothetical protein DRN25_02695 [Thermoplasmata archaeon]
MKDKKDTYENLITPAPYLSKICCKFSFCKRNCIALLSAFLQLGKIPSEHPKPGGSKNHGDISSFSNLYRYSSIGTYIPR